MFLDVYNNNGFRYIRICESYRIEKNGVRVARKRQIMGLLQISEKISLICNSPSRITIQQFVFHRFPSSL